MGIGRRIRGFEGDRPGLKIGWSRRKKCGEPFFIRTPNTLNQMFPDDFLRPAEPELARQGVVAFRHVAMLKNLRHQLLLRQIHRDGVVKFDSPNRFDGARNKLAIPLFTIPQGCLSPFTFCDVANDADDPEDLPAGAKVRAVNAGDPAGLTGCRHLEGHVWCMHDLSRKGATDQEVHALLS